MSLRNEFFQKLVTEEEFERTLAEVADILREEGSHQRLQGRQNTTPTEKLGKSADKKPHIKGPPATSHAVNPPAPEGPNGEKVKQQGRTAGLSPQQQGVVRQGILNAVTRSKGIRGQVIGMIAAALQAKGANSAEAQPQQQQTAGVKQ